MSITKIMRNWKIKSVLARERAAIATVTVGAV